ncbi:MAG: hypothetical protein ACO24U_09670 [Prochlorococcaceae cyanobacterium]
MQRPAQSRSVVLIALTLVALGAIATASAKDQRGKTPDLVAAAPDPARAQLDLNKLPPSSAEQLALSRHLKEIGALFYGAWWCPACTRQKALFGRQASQQLPYVECDRQPSDRDVCIAAQIKAFPTWELKGKERLVGVQSLDELKSWSGYPAKR